MTVSPITDEERREVQALSRVTRHGDWFTSPTDVVARYEARLSQAEADRERLVEALRECADETRRTLDMHYASNTTNLKWREGDEYDFETIDDRRDYADCQRMFRRLTAARALLATLEKNGSTT